MLKYPSFLPPAQVINDLCFCQFSLNFVEFFIDGIMSAFLICKIILGFIYVATYSNSLFFLLMSGIQLFYFDAIINY